VRQFFTLRFWLTVLALVGLTAAISVAFRDQGTQAGDVAAPTSGFDRTIDLVSWVFLVVPPEGFTMKNGRANADLVLQLDGTRTMVVKAGTPGAISCTRLTEVAQCVVAADLLGDAVLWFDIVPGTPGSTVQLPAVVELLDGGWVRLANDWIVRHAGKVVRSCPAETSSLTDFIETFGDKATSTFNFEQQQIVKVTCPRL